MLTSPEIKELMVAAQNENMLFDFRSDVYLDYMNYEDAKEYLNEGTTEEQWIEALTGDGHYPPSDEVVRNDMKSYMVFAIGKALDHRGLSANRSVQKMEAYARILGFYDQIDWDAYANYGAPILKAICDHMAWKELYEGQDEFLRMAEGKKCRPDCVEGCGLGWIG